MKFLIDRCAGRRLGEWLRSQGHDVVDSRDFGDDPGDWEMLARAGAEDRILVTLDTDFAALIYVQAAPHAGLVRLPDVPTDQRIALMAEVLERHRRALETRALVTVRENRIRISRPPSP